MVLTIVLYQQPDMLLAEELMKLDAAEPASDEEETLALQVQTPLEVDH